MRIVDALLLEYSEKIICLGDNGSVYCLNHKLDLLGSIIDDEDVDITCLQVSHNGRCVQMCSSNGELYYYEFCVCLLTVYLSLLFQSLD